MKRRSLLALGTATVCAPAAGGANSDASQGRRHAFVLGSPFTIDQASQAVNHHGENIRIIQLQSGTFHLDENDRLIAKVRAHVAQYNNVNLDVSFAIFDGQSTMLGVARHTEVVRKIYVSAMMTTIDDWTIDFGHSKHFRNASGLAIAFHDVPIPAPFESTTP